jgi:transposase InsO family protein
MALNRAPFDTVVVFFFRSKMEHTCSCNFDLKGEAKRARTKLSSPIIPSNSDKVFGTHKIRDKPIAPPSPWQNGLAERPIGSIRRECSDRIIVLGEEHLRRILKNYAAYYNGVRTHRSFNKDAPISGLVQRSDIISSHVILGGLHHQYARI